MTSVPTAAETRPAGPGSLRPSTVAQSPVPGRANGGPLREVVAPLAEQVVADTLRADINTVLPLEQAAGGMVTLASRTARGKIVVTVAD